MEEKKKDFSELSSEGNLNMLVGTIKRRADWVQGELGKISLFESPVHSAEFKRRTNGKDFGVNSTLGHVWIFYGPTDRPFLAITGYKIPAGMCAKQCFYCSTQDYLKNILLKEGLEWKSLGELIYDQLGLVFPEISKIRRNILYPEVAEMERKLESLSSISEEMVNEINSLKFQLAEKEKEIELLNHRSENTHNIIETFINGEKNQDDFRRYFPSKKPENCNSDAEKIWNILVEKCEIKNQLAEKERSIDCLHNAIEQAIFGLAQTKKFFKSKAVAAVRENLIACLPIEKKSKFSFKLQPPEPWPEPPREEKIGFEPKTPTCRPVGSPPPPPPGPCN